MILTPARGARRLSILHPPTSPLASGFPTVPPRGTTRRDITASTSVADASEAERMRLMGLDGECDWVRGPAHRGGGRASWGEAREDSR